MMIELVLFSILSAILGLMSGAISAVLVSLIVKHYFKREDLQILHNLKAEVNSLEIKLATVSGKYKSNASVERREQTQQEINTALMQIGAIYQNKEGDLKSKLAQIVPIVAQNPSVLKYLSKML